MTTTIRRICVTVLMTGGALGALTTTSEAQLPLEPIAVVLDHDRATTSSNAEHENAVAACMADRGFEYAPWIGTVTVTPAVGAHSDGPDVAHPSLVELDGPSEDPNAAIVDALGVAERVDYFHALYGDRVVLDGEGRLAGASLTSTDEGCS